ncbi:hypothetical protein BGZ57DRAFT_1011080 [Hyaloscypha finlandica]|nr:hypothetical protein BGZ57DRAFT_1011080 [Hyaloscypha finlandica]
MKIVVAKVDKRRREVDKDTAVLHNRVQIPSEKFQRFKRGKANRESYPVSPSVGFCSHNVLNRFQQASQRHQKNSHISDQGPILKARSWVKMKAFTRASSRGQSAKAALNYAFHIHKAQRNSHKITNNSESKEFVSHLISPRCIARKPNKSREKSPTNLHPSECSKPKKNYRRLLDRGFGSGLGDLEAGAPTPAAPITPISTSFQRFRPSIISPKSRVNFYNISYCPPPAPLRPPSHLLPSLSLSPVLLSLSAISRSAEKVTVAVERPAVSVEAIR